MRTTTPQVTEKRPVDENNPFRDKNPMALASLGAKLVVLSGCIQEIFNKYRPPETKAAVSPAIHVIQKAYDELLASRETGLQELNLKNSIRKKCESINRRVGSATPEELACVILTELEGMRSRGSLGLGEASHASVAIFQLHKNYDAVFESLQGVLRPKIMRLLSKKLVKI